MNSNVFKIVSFTASAVGMAAGLVGTWADDKKLDAKILEKVNEALKKN